MSCLIYLREEWVTNGNGKNGDNRNNWQSSQRRRRNNKQKQPKAAFGQTAPKENQNTKQETRGSRPEKASAPVFERPKWSPPKLSTEPFPQPECPYCGKPVRDITIAVGDKETNAAVHFDCILARLNQSEPLEKGESITYIGGGRFGVIRQGTPENPKKFIIKKIFEWEEKDNRASWRGTVSDHYSIT